MKKKTAYAFSREEYRELRHHLHKQNFSTPLGIYYGREFNENGESNTILAMLYIDPHSFEFIVIPKPGSNIEEIIEDYFNQECKLSGGLK